MKLGDCYKGFSKSGIIVGEGYTVIDIQDRLFGD